MATKTNITPFSRIDCEGKEINIGDRIVRPNPYRNVVDICIVSRITPRMIFAKRESNGDELQCKTSKNLYKIEKNVNN